MGLAQNQELPQVVVEKEPLKKVASVVKKVITALKPSGEHPMLQVLRMFTFFMGVSIVLGKHVPILAWVVLVFMVLTTLVENNPSGNDVEKSKD